MSTTTPLPAGLRWTKPFLVLLAALGIGTLLMAPMVAMEPRDLPLAVVNLDEGVETPQGQVNAGEQVIEAIQSDDANGLVAWRALDDQAALDAALEDNDVYAALVVPADFGVSQAMAQQGQGEASPLRLIVNEGKNPMVTGQLSGSLSALTAGSDLPVETEYYHEVPDSLGLVASFLPMVLMILTYISSYATGVVIRSVFPLRATGRAARVATQLGVAALAAIAVGYLGSSILDAMVDLEVSVPDVAPFMAISSFALMTLVIGSVNWIGLVGMAVPILILVLGLGPADLPFEFLPVFWQDFVYPWNPLRFLADGARAVLYQGAGWWNPATLGLVLTALIGIVLVATSVLTPRRDKGQRAAA